MINDFEWKLHEIESEYNRKLREGEAASSVQAQAGASSSRRQRSPLKSQIQAPSGSSNFDHDLFELKLQQAKNEIVRQKDEELAKMHIQIRKEMDDKLRLERNSLKSALDASHSSELSRAVDNARKDAERDAKINEKKTHEENEKLQAQIQSLQREIAQLNQKVIDSVNTAVAEGDKKVMVHNFDHFALVPILSFQAFEERKRASTQAENHQNELEKIRDDLNGQLSRLRVDYDEKVEDLEKRLEVALGAKLEHMMALREEVEQEYADRMEDLRNMYRTEMDAQTDTYEKERDKFRQIESSLSETLKVKRHEADEYKSK